MDNLYLSYLYTYYYYYYNICRYWIINSMKMSNHMRDKYYMMSNLCNMGLLSCRISIVRSLDLRNIVMLCCKMSIMLGIGKLCNMGECSFGIRSMGLSYL